MAFNNDFVIGYKLDAQGCHNGGVVLPATAENICRFLLSDNSDKVVTDVFDNLLCTTFGTFLDRCDGEFRRHIIDTLVRKQMSGVVGEEYAVVTNRD